MVREIERDLTNIAGRLEMAGYTIPTQMLMNQVNISITNLRTSLAGLRQKINASGSKVKIHSVNNGYILLNT